MESREKPCMDADPLDQAWQVQQKAHKKGFDWPDIAGPLDKVAEELDEIRADLAAGKLERARKELGDLLFAVVNLSRFLDALPGQELICATKRFEARFDRLCSIVSQSGRPLVDHTLEELDVVWEAVKAAE